MNRFRTMVLTAVAGLALVACGPAASGSAQPSQEQSQAAQASGGGAGPSFTAGAVSELENLIPDSAGGVTLNKASTQGNDYLVSSDADPQTVAFLQDLGVSPSDVSMAYGIGLSTDATSGVAMFVFRAAGADSNRLVAAFKTANNSETESPLQWSSSTVGGKSVEVAESNGQSTYLYVKGDILFFIGAGTQAVAEEILNGLP